ILLLSLPPPPPPPSHSLSLSHSLTLSGCLSGGAVSSDNVCAWLRPFCGDDGRPVRPRIEVLKVLEHSFSLSEEDIRLLVFFRSQAVLKAGWRDREVHTHTLTHTHTQRDTHTR